MRACVCVCVIVSAGYVAWAPLWCSSSPRAFVVSHTRTHTAHIQEIIYSPAMTGETPISDETMDMIMEQVLPFFF